MNHSQCIVLVLRRSCNCTSRNQILLGHASTVLSLPQVSQSAHAGTLKNVEKVRGATLH